MNAQRHFNTLQRACRGHISVCIYIFIYVYPDLFVEVAYGHVGICEIYSA